MSQTVVLKRLPALPASTGVVRARWQAGMPYTLLALVLLAIYAYTPPRWQDWNQNSRFDLTRAIVERRTLRIDAYVENTGDYAVVDGHAYTDKAPGLSLIATPVYAGVHALRPYGLSALAQRLGGGGAFASTLNPDGSGLNAAKIDEALALYIATLLCVTAPAVGALVVLAYTVARLAGCRTAAVGSALLIGLATPVFTYSQAFYGHIPAAACLTGAFALVAVSPTPLPGRRALGVGALLGLAVLIEYPAAVAGLPIALWAWHRGRARGALLGIAGAIPPLLVLVAYDLLAFGTPLPVGYAHSALWQEQHQTGFMSLTRPHWDAIWGLSGSPFRGLLFVSPVLVVAAAGAARALRNPAVRQPLLVACAAFAGMFVFAASSVMWWGGFAVGPRYLLPAAPLLGIPLGFALAWLNAARLRVRLAGLGGIGILGGVSCAVVWALTFAGQQYPPDTIRRPLTDYALPALRDGDVARNLGMALHLAGLASLIPLLVGCAIGVGLLAIALARQERVAT